eukprot:1514724-Pleurochrysis_carterae.AAC.6
MKGGRVERETETRRTTEGNDGCTQGYRAENNTQTRACMEMRHARKHMEKEEDGEDGQISSKES